MIVLGFTFGRCDPRHCEKRIIGANPMAKVADHIRAALKFVPVERLVISTDCGMGREGMSRRHAFFKMVALVQGTNIVRRELGLPEAKCRAGDERYILSSPAR